MATARKLPSGNWRARATYTDDEGIRHFKSFTASTKKDAEMMALIFEKPDSAKQDMTFGEAFELYINSRVNILSPASIRGYKQCRSYFESIEDKPLDTFNQDFVTIFMNRFAGTHSPKTCRNAHGLLAAILRDYAGLTLKTKLPQKVVPEYVLPTDEDIERILKHLSEMDPELKKAVLLAAFGTLRRSEICALTSEDVKGNIIHVKKAMVKTDAKEWVVKTTKTVSSDRYITFPDFVIETLPQEGRLVDLCPDVITHRFNRTLKRLGIPSFRFHDLRHYAASIMHAMGVPDQYIMATGGWKSDGVLKAVYRNTISTFQKQYDDKRIEYFEKFNTEK